MRHSTDSADGLNYAIDRHFSTHREADHHANGDMRRKASRMSATFQIIPSGERWAWRAKGKGAQPKWSALLAPAIRENDTYVEFRGLRKRDDADGAVEEASMEELEHGVVNRFFVALRGHCDRFGPPSKRMRSTADADVPALASGPAPAPEPAEPQPSAIPIAPPPPTPPLATPPPDVLITAVPYHPSSTAHLKNVEPEALEAQVALGGPGCAEVRLNISFAELDIALKGRSTWWFAGHGDAPLAGEQVPTIVPTHPMHAPEINHAHLPVNRCPAFSSTALLRASLSM